MLLLDAKQGEAIYVGDMKIILVKIGEHRVKLGFEGPKDIIVTREKLLEGNSNESRS